MNATIETIDAFSGHADHPELLDRFRETGGAKKKVWLVHGEGKHSEALKVEFEKNHPESDIAVGRLGEAVTF